MGTPGQPPQQQYQANYEIPQVRDEFGRLAETIWRCEQCSHVITTNPNTTYIFPSCPSCNGQRWAFAGTGAAT